jgi:hypothetical protein
MTVATLKADFGVSLTGELPLLQGWQSLLDETYRFIHAQVLPPFGWALFDNTLEKYQAYRRAHYTADIDVFPIAACLGAGGTVAQALPVAASWALYVFAGRLFDDLADGEGEEKNLFAPTTAAASLSTCLFANSAANAALWHLADKTVASHIATAFSQAIGLALKSENGRQSLHHLSLETYFETIAAKTGVIFATGAWAGGRGAVGGPNTVKNPNDEVLNALYAFGLHLGMMTQIVDDCFDLEKDLVNQVWTLPVIYGLSQTDHFLYPRLRDLLIDRQSTTWVEESIALLGEMDAVAWSRQMAEIHRQQALAVLDKLPSDVSYLRYYVTPKSQ